MALRPANMLWIPALAYAVAAGGYGVARGLQAPPERTVTTASSDDCARCHPREHASWSVTYHRTMTQVPTRETVLAPFAGERLEALGFTATMTWPEQWPHVRVVATDGQVLLDTDVALAIGSHRYQQYAAWRELPGGARELWRLPVAWHPGLTRWIHLNGAFVEPDGVPGEAADYLRHYTRYNDNCLFCHNTRPSPGLREDGTFASKVAELGIGCEACHGPAADHAAAYADPMARLVAGSGAEAVTSLREAPRVQSDACGQCHGQRIASDVDTVLRHGDGFVPGEPLAHSSRPIFRDSKLAGLPEGAFASRFWGDGTPRLSAYEYQGLLMSPCWNDGEGMGCGTCHSMHDADPDQQLRPFARTGAVCETCHTRATLSAEMHLSGGPHSATDCYDCHMPRVTYGLLQGMRSHRVTTPRPGATEATAPDACSLCHVDRTQAELWGQDLGSERAAAQPSEVERLLFAGDAIARNLAADALRRPSAQGSLRRRAQALAWALDDDYASVRLFAARGVAALAKELGLATVLRDAEAFDYMGAPEVRVLLSARIRAALGPWPAEAALPELKAARADEAIWIGE